MLVLSRKVGEVIRIGDYISVKVISIKGRRMVEIGIEAPSSVRIRRGEIKRHGGDDADEER